MAARTQFANIPQEFGRANFHGPVTLSGAGKTKLELRLDLDQSSVTAHGSPTIVYRGIVYGYSMPVNVTDDELFFVTDIPRRWDGTSNFTFHIHCYLAVAETNAFFKFEVAYVSFADGEVVPDTSTPVETNTATGTSTAQYTMFDVDFTVPGAGVAWGDELDIRLQRVEATGQECSGDIVVTHAGLVFVRDKLGAPV